MFFDGSSKSKRQINLGGRSALEAPKDRKALLRQAQEERRFREEERRRHAAILVIQAFFRACRDLTRWRARERASWDSRSASIAACPAQMTDWLDLVATIVFIFNVRKADCRRVQWLVHHASADAPASLSAQRPSLMRRLMQVVLKCLRERSVENDGDNSMVEFLVACASLKPDILFGSKASTEALHGICSKERQLDVWIPLIGTMAAFSPTVCLETIFSIPDLQSRLSPQGFVGLCRQVPVLSIAEALGRSSAELFAGKERSVLTSTLANFLAVSRPEVESRNARFLQAYLEALRSLLVQSENPARKRDAAVPPQLLESSHLSLVFGAIAGNKSEDQRVSVQLFCDVVASLLPHISLTKSPFALLTQAHLVERIFNAAFAEGKHTANMAVIPVSAAIDCVSQDRPHLRNLYVLADMSLRLFSAYGDEEFYAFKWLSRQQLVTLIDYLRWVAFNVVNTGLVQFSRTYLNSFVSLLQHLFLRDSRRRFTPSKEIWWVAMDRESFVKQAIAEMQMPGVADLAFASGYASDSESDDEENVRPALDLAVLSPRHWILREIPFVIPFEDRLRLFREYIVADRLACGVHDHPVLREDHKVVIRRDRVFEDGFAKLDPLGPRLKDRLSIIFLSELGLEEAGIDGGGVFKEFFTMLSQEAFNPNMGLFEVNADHQLYPSAHGTTQLALYAFIGRIIGKALYDGILLETSFAPFFLNRWLGKRNFLDDLPAMDPELYKNLLFLKTYEGNVEELAVNFTLMYEELGKQTTVELIPNGRNIPVTEANRIKYCYLVANYKLNILSHRQCNAFLSGVSELLRPDWLRMFNQQELGTLISGSRVEIDVVDMRSNTVYGGGYSDRHPIIEMFWQVVHEMSADDKRLLLKFITSCTRAPLLGFKELVPSLCIRMAGDDQDRLPTSSTCINLLKLPSYQSRTLLREKLLYSIRAGAGFELS